MSLPALGFTWQIDLFIAKQFLFQRQWQKLHDYARMKGVSIMGDMPIYVGYHSADVWANKKHFLLVSLFMQEEGIIIQPCFKAFNCWCWLKIYIFSLAE